MNQTSGLSEIINTDRRALIDQIDKLIHVITKRFGQEMARVVEGRISVSQFLLLRSLNQSEPARISQIAEKMQVTSSAVTFLTDKLIEQELIGRKRDKTDRRAVYIFVTKKGADLVEELESLRREAAESLLSNLSDLELSNIVTILDKLANSMAIA